MDVAMMVTIEVLWRLMFIMMLTLSMVFIVRSGTISVNIGGDDYYDFDHCYHVP